MVCLCALLYRASLPLERVCVQGVPFPALVDTKSDTISVKSKPGNRSIASPTPSVPKLPHDVDLRYFQSAESRTARTSNTLKHCLFSKKKSVKFEYFCLVRLFSFCMTVLICGTFVYTVTRVSCFEMSCDVHDIVLFNIVPYLFV